MRHDDRGFSLFEILIAFTIMTVVLAAIIPGQARLLGRTVTEESRLLAQDYAFSLISELELEEPPEVSSEQRAYRQWTVVTDIRPVSADVFVKPVVSISVRILSLTGTELAYVETLRSSE